MKSYTQTKNKFILSIMFMAFVLFALGGVFMFRHSTTSANAAVVTYGNETLTLGNATYSWSILDAEAKTAKLYKVTMEEDGALVLPSKLTKDGVDYTITQMYDSSTNNQNGVFYPSKDKITSIAFANDNQIANIGGYAFYDCDKLASVNIPKTITSIGIGAFADCGNLGSVLYDANITDTFTLGKGIFNNSGKQLNLNIEDNVTSIPAYAFSGMSNISNVYFDANSKVATIGAGAFMNANLKNITIPASVTTIADSAFNGNPAMNISVASGNTNFAVSNTCLYGVVEGKKTTLMAIPTSTTTLVLDADCTSISANAFYGCTALTNVTTNDKFAFVDNCLYQLVDGKKQILVYVTSSATTFTPDAECTQYLDNAFINATSLQTLTITDKNIADTAYEGNTSLVDVVIAEGVQSIGNYAFADCTSLRSVTIPSTVTTIYEGAFSGCTNLTTINYNATNATVDATMVHSSNVFHNAGTATDAGFTVNVGANVTHIPAGLFATRNSDYAPKLTTINFAEGSVLNTIGADAFNMVASLTSIDLPATVTTIGNSAFEGTGLTAITIPSAVTSIGNKAFFGAKSLTSLEFANTDSNATTLSIGTEAFKTTKIAELTLYPNVNNIGANAFNNIAELKKVTFTHPDMDEIEIGAGAFLSNNAGVKYYFYDHAYTLANTIFTNTTNNQIYVVTLKNGSDVFTTLNGPKDAVLTLPSAEELTRDGFGLVGWSTVSDSKTGTWEYTIVGNVAANVLYAIWQEQFTITFDMQQGTAGSTSVAAVYGAAMPTITPPTRDGYRFDGYYTGTNAEGIRYYAADGSSYRNWDIIANTTLYANWIQLYTVTLDKANGEGGTDSIQYAIGDVLTNIEIPSRTGYNFLGYYLGETQIFNAQGQAVADIMQTGATDASADTFTFQDTTINTLVARWEAIEYTVTFNSGTGYTITATKNGLEFTSGSKVTIEDTVIFTLTTHPGYTADTLAVSGEAGTYTFANNTLSGVSGDVVVSAASEIQEFNLTVTNGEGYTILVNGAEWTGGKIKVTDTLALTVTADTGYTAGNILVNGIDGKFTREGDTITNIACDLAITASATLNNYIITIQSGLGYTITATKSGAVFRNGDTMTIKDTVVFTVNPAKGYTAGELVVTGSAYTLNENTLTNVNENLTISSSATATQYTITFDVPTGAKYTITGTLNGTTAFASGNTLTIADTLTLRINPNAGYTAGSLSVSGDATQRVFNGETLSHVNTNITVTGNAIPNTFQIVYNKNHQNATSTMANTAMTYDVEASLRNNAFILTGYEFLGWSTEADGEVDYLNGATVSNLTTENNAMFNLYAIWNPISYTIEYHKSAPASASTTISGETLANNDIKYDENITLRACNFTLVGYRFMGWAKTANGNVVYTDEQNVSNLTTEDGDIVELYSVWAPITYSIVFNAIKPVSALENPTGSMANYTATFDSKITLPVCGYTLSGWNLAGWATTQNGNVVYENNAEITTNLTTTHQDTVNLFTVWEIATYSITYANSNTCAIAVDKSGAPVPSGSKLTVNEAITITLTPIAGYENATYTISPANKCQVTPHATIDNAYVIQNIIGDIEISASATAKTNTPYIVYHYQQVINPTPGANDTVNYALADTDDLEGTTGTLTSATSKGYSGFELRDPIVQQTILGNGSTIINVYYDRIIYTITFVVDDQKATTTDELVYNLAYGATVTAPTLTTVYYDFVGWTPSLNTTVSESATYTATFTPKSYDVTIISNDSTAGIIYNNISKVEAVPFGTKITANGNILTIHIPGAPKTIQGVPTESALSSATQYRLINWYYNGTTVINNTTGVTLDVTTATITAHFEKRLISLTNTAGQLDMSTSIGVPENSELKIEEANTDTLNSKLAVPAGKRAIQGYNINVFEKSTTNVVSTIGEIKVILNASDEMLRCSGLQMLVYDANSDTVITCDATITGDKITFTTTALGQMLLVANANTGFPWWIIILTVIVIAVVAVLYWLLAIRRKNNMNDDDDKANDNYDSVLNGLVDDKKSKEVKTSTVEEVKTPEGKLLKKTETTKTTTTTQSVKNPNDNKKSKDNKDTDSK